MSEISFDTQCTPGDAEWQRRLDIFMNDPAPMSWWWLSFCDGDDGHFLGVCVVPASNVVMAGQFAWALGCNPGGEIGGYPGCPPGWHPKPEYVGKLFAGDEGRALAEMELEEWCEPDG